MILAHLDDRRVLEPIIEKLSDPDDVMRIAAMMTLTQLKDARAVEALIPLVNNTWVINALVIDALVAINDSRAVEPIIVLLQHENVRIRTRAAEALGDFRDERAVAALIQSLNDWGNQGLRVSFSTDPGIAAFPCVCHYAAQALLKIGTQEAIEGVEQWRSAHPNAGELPT
jgi:HEAT repeat protein